MFTTGLNMFVYKHAIFYKITKNDNGGVVSSIARPCNQVQSKAQRFPVNSEKK